MFRRLSRTRKDHSSTEPRLSEVITQLNELFPYYNYKVEAKSRKITIEVLRISVSRISSKQITMKLALLLLLVGVAFAAGKFGFLFR